MREDLLALRRHAEEEPDRHGTGTAAQDGGRRVVWRAGPAGLSTKPHAVPLTPAWRLFLLGDGSATRSLSLLTGADIRVDVIEMQDLADEADGPEELDQVAAPQLRRGVWLRADGGAVLGYAVSWWNARLARDYLTDPACRSGRILTACGARPIATSARSFTRVVLGLRRRSVIRGRSGGATTSCASVARRCASFARFFRRRWTGH